VGEGEAGMIAAALNRSNLASLLLALAALGTAHSQTWQRSTIDDALRKTSVTQYILQGKYLVAPKTQKPGEFPALVVRCSAKPHSVGYHVFVNGAFLAGYLVTGVIVDSQVTIHEGLLGTSFPVVIPVTFRLDEGKLQTENWRTSTDHSAAFFSEPTLNNLLYGHVVRHKENTTEQVHKVIIGLDEAFAGEVQIQFDMPDVTEVAEACGAVLHKK
jgi:hypothetical protein